MIVRAESGRVRDVLNRRNFRRVMLAGMGDAAPTFSTPSGACTPTSCAGPYANARDNYLVQFQVQTARPANQLAYVTQLESGQPLLSNGEFRALFGYPWGECSAFDSVCQGCMQQAASAADALWTSTRGVWPRGTAVNWQCDTSGAVAPTGLPGRALTPAGSYIPPAQLTGGQVVFSGLDPLAGPTLPVPPAASVTARPASRTPPVPDGGPTLTPSAGAVQSNAPGAVVVARGAAQSNAPGSAVALPASAAAAVASAGSFLTGSLVAGVPNWVLVAGGLLLFMRGGHK